MSNKVLVVYQNKEDRTYLRKEVYTLSEKFSKQFFDETTEKYNKDEHKDCVTLYYDDLLCEMVEVIGSSELFNDCISNLRSISSSIRCNIEDLESWDDTISELLENLKPESEE